MGRCLPMDSWASVQSNRVLRPNLAFNNVTLGGMLSADLPALDTQYLFGTDDKINRFTKTRQKVGLTTPTTVTALIQLLLSFLPTILRLQIGKITVLLNFSGPKFNHTIRPIQPAQISPGPLDLRLAHPNRYQPTPLAPYGRQKRRHRKIRKSENPQFSAQLSRLGVCKPNLT